MDLERLEHILHCGDAEACLTFFAEAPEEERRRASKTVLESLRGIEQEWMYWHLVGGSECSTRRDARGVALLASCSLGELKHDRMHLLPNLDYAYKVLADRRPEWLEDFPDAVLAFSPGYLAFGTKTCSRQSVPEARVRYLHHQYALLHPVLETCIPRTKRFWSSCGMTLNYSTTKYGDCLKLKATRHAVWLDTTIVHRLLSAGIKH